jgi:hypothetical protein
LVRLIARQAKASSASNESRKARTCFLYALSSLISGEAPIPHYDFMIRNVKLLRGLS